MDAKKFFRNLIIIVIVAIFLFDFFKYSNINSKITDVNSLVQDKASMHYNNDLYISDGRYYKYMLDKSEKKLYEDLYNSIRERKTFVKLDFTEFDYSNFTASITIDTAMERVFQALSMDHPELIYYSPAANSFSYTTDSKYINLSFTYSMDDATYQNNISKIQEILTQIKSDTTDMDDYEKCKYVYEWLGKNNVYGDINGSLSHSAYSAFFKEEPTVCEGYGKAAQIIFQNIGVNSIYVVGRADGVGHGWNLVKLDGKYYYFDATVTSAFKKSVSDPMNYAGFLIEDVSRYSITYKDLLPKINGKEYLYFKNNNLEYKFEDSEESYKKLKEIVDNSENGIVVGIKVKNIGKLKNYRTELKNYMGKDYQMLVGFDDIIFYSK